MKYRMDESILTMLTEIEGHASVAKKASEEVQAGIRKLKRSLPDTVDAAVKTQIEKIFAKMSDIPRVAPVNAVSAAQESIRHQPNMSATVRDTLMQQISQHGKTTNRAIRTITGARSVTVSIQVRYLIANGTIVRDDATRTYLPGPNFKPTANLTS